MKTLTLQELVDKAGKMALQNIWEEKSYKINMEILKIDKNNCAACTRLAKYYKVNNNLAEAKNMYLRTLEIDPQNRGAINNLSDMQREQAENDIVDQMDTTGELLKEGKHSMIKGKYKLAVKLFSKAYDIKPILLHAVLLAGAYKKMGKDDCIEELYNKLINDSPADVEAIKTEFKALR